MAAYGYERTFVKLRRYPRLDRRAAHGQFKARGYIMTKKRDAAKRGSKDDVPAAIITFPKTGSWNPDVLIAEFAVRAIHSLMFSQGSTRLKPSPLRRCWKMGT